LAVVIIVVIIVKFLVIDCVASDQFQLTTIALSDGQPLTAPLILIIHILWCDVNV